MKRYQKILEDQGIVKYIPFFKDAMKQMALDVWLFFNGMVKPPHPIDEVKTAFEQWWNEDIEDTNEP
jgi:hypothetical protein